MLIYTKLSLLSPCLDLITSSTCSLSALHLGWLICPVSRPSSAYSAHSYLSLQAPELQCPRPSFGNCSLHRWPLIPGSLWGSLCPALGSLESISIWPSACSPSRQPTCPTWECPFRSVFLTWFTDTGLDLLLVSSPKVIPRAFRSKEGLCGQVTVPALNALLSTGHIRRQGVDLSVLARLLPTRHDQHVCRALLLGNMFWAQE